MRGDGEGLYVIVGLTFISGLLGTAHHYYYVGVPSYWLPIGGVFSALEPLVFVAMSAYAYQAIRRSGFGHPNTLAVHWTIGSAIFSALGAGLLGLARGRRSTGGRMGRSSRRCTATPHSSAPTS